MPHPEVAGTHLSQKEIKEQTVLGLHTPKRLKADRGGSTRWGRLALRADELLTTPRSAKKLQEIVGLSADKIPKVIDETNTPPARRRSELLRIQQGENGSPMRVLIETDIPSPYKNPLRKRLDREFSAAEIRCANRIPLTRSAVKTAKRRISAEDIEKARETPRQFKKELRLSADIATSVWGTDSTTVSNEGVVVPKNEKTHLIAHSAGGKETLPYIVFASGPANSKMIGGDAGAAALVEEKLCNYVENTATATLRQKPGSKLYTHHADHIEMEYKTDNTGLIFQIPPIDANLNTRPSVGEIELTKTLMVECQKAALEKQAKESNKDESSPTVCSSSNKKRKRENTIESHFLGEHPENATKSHPVKRKKLNTPKSATAKPTHKITTFFPIVNLENTPLNLPSQTQALAPKCTFFTPASQSENTPIAAAPPSIRLRI